MTLFKTVFITLLAITSAAFAQDSSNNIADKRENTKNYGSAKGAQAKGVKKLKKEEAEPLILADLLKTECEPSKTERFLKDYHLQDNVDKILASLQESNAYMAYRIRKELAAMNWCLTESRLVPQYLRGNPRFASYDPEKQIAVRQLSAPKAWIDLGYFAEMKLNSYVLGDDAKLTKDEMIIKYNQSMLIIHEVVQSFVSKERENRHIAVMEITRAIYTDFALSAKKANLEARRAELDGAIVSSNTQEAFLNSKFSLAFVEYLIKRDERSAQKMAFHDHGWGYRDYIDILVNDFGAADVLGKAPYASPQFATNPPQEYRVPEKYLFALTLNDMWRKITYINQLALPNFGSVSQTLQDPTPAYDLGACKVFPKTKVTFVKEFKNGYGSGEGASVDLYKLNFEAGAILTTAKRSTESAAITDKYNLGVSIAGKNNWDGDAFSRGANSNSQGVSPDLIQNIFPDLYENSVNDFNRSLRGLFRELNKGLCNIGNPRNATGYQYLPYLN